MIPVNKPYMPPLDEVTALLEQVWSRAWLTNQGPLARALEERIAARLGRSLFVANGTVAIHLALRALQVRGTVLTTPFSFVATASAPVLAGHDIRFADIDPATLNLDPGKVREAMDDDVGAILATHVYGNACDVDALQSIADEAGIPVIYDAAHAVGATLRGRPLLSFGNGATSSLHATKVVHSAEGGLVQFRDDDAHGRAVRLRNFGIDSAAAGIPTEPGLNAKNSELHAAVGLVAFERLDAVIAKRLALAEHYASELDGLVELPLAHAEQTTNAAYAPILLESEEQRAAVEAALAASDIGSRRYFYPALNTLPWTGGPSMPVAESAARRVLCLPLYYDLTAEEVHRICGVIRRCLGA
jgi:dTDP-4-amino-4,6-dideoxygalactose transaminase